MTQEMVCNSSVTSQSHKAKIPFSQTNTTQLNQLSYAFHQQNNTLLGACVRVPLVYKSHRTDQLPVLYLVIPSKEKYVPSE